MNFFTVGTTITVTWMLLVTSLDGCITRSYLYQTRQGRLRQMNSHVFAYNEYQPIVAEQSIQASGMAPRKASKASDLTKVNVPADMLEFRTRHAKRMSTRCREKLEHLSLLVFNQWQGRVRLRLLNGWYRPKYVSEVGQGHSDVLHHSGRAVDMTLITAAGYYAPRDATPGKLAQMAYYEAYFDYCRHLGDFVHCSVKSDDPDSTNSWLLACFPYNSTVTNPNGNPMSMKSLQSGALVTTSDLSNNNPSTTQFVTFIHDNSRVINMPFLSILTQSGHTLVVSHRHLLPIYRGGQTKTVEFAFSQSVNLKDFLLVTDNNSNKKSYWSKVSKISEVRMDGVLAPMTLSGTLFVNGVFTSNYAHISNHYLAHWAMSPVRMAHYFSNTHAPKQKNTYLSDSNFTGIHWYSRLLYDLFYWMHL